MPHLEFFDSRFVEMMREVRNHPDLVKRITEAELAGQNAHSLIFTYQKGDKDVDIIRNAEEGLGFIAAYVGIALDGEYSQKDILDIMDKIRARLQERRINATAISSGKVKKEESRGDEGKGTGKKPVHPGLSRIIIPDGYKH